MKKNLLLKNKILKALVGFFEDREKEFNLKNVNFHSKPKKLDSKSSKSVDDLLEEIIEIVKTTE